MQEHSESFLLTVAMQFFCDTVYARSVNKTTVLGMFCYSMNECWTAKTGSCYYLSYVVYSSVVIGDMRECVQ